MQNTFEVLIILSTILLMGLTIKVLPNQPSILLLVSFSGTLFLLLVTTFSRPCSKKYLKKSTDIKTETKPTSKAFKDLEKKVTFNTQKNQEVEIAIGKLPIDYQDPSIKNLQEISIEDYPMNSHDQINQRDCTQDLSCIITPKPNLDKVEDLDGYQRFNHQPRSIEKTLPANELPSYMTSEQLEGYAPDGLKICSDLTGCKEAFQAPLFENIPPESSLENQLCRHCKVGYCLGGICGSEIFKKPSELPNYYQK